MLTAAQREARRIKDRDAYRREHPNARMRVGPLTKENVADHFVVNELTGCWEWRLKSRRRDYGEKLVNGKKHPAHVAIYELLRGPIPHGLHLCHRCDNRSCVNPDHMFIGTHQDNMRDRQEKGRQARGERQGLSKLTEQIVRRMRELCASGVTHAQAARDFGVDKATARRAILGHTWRHVA